MRVSLPSQQPPGLLEQVLGRRRARTVRRRLGFVALGVGYTLLKPRVRWRPAAMVVSVTAVAIFLVAHVAA